MESVLNYSHSQTSLPPPGFVSKVIEIRDDGTSISALALRWRATDPAGFHHVHLRCGHPQDGSNILLVRIDDGKATHDWTHWAALGLGRRTMQVAHQYIEAHFDELEHGQVVDVEFILGESSTPKTPERLRD